MIRHSYFWSNLKPTLVQIETNYLSRMEVIQPKMAASYVIYFLNFIDKGVK